VIEAPRRPSDLFAQQIARLILPHYSDREDCEALEALLTAWGRALTDEAVRRIDAALQPKDTQ
jgi:hypothetical protein